MNKKKGLVANLEFVREDDFVEYYIFPEITDEVNVKEQLEAICQQCMDLVKNKVSARNYIWHKDEFGLQIRTGSEEERLLNDELTETAAAELPLPAHLHGVTHFGDNIADEWFIVYLISELTRCMPNCIARVYDADGEFLLIEAADVLPNWANPDTCEQRVYIVDGTLQLIQNSPTNTVKRLPVVSAIEKIRLNPSLYRVNIEIQACINERLQEFKADEPLPTLHRQIVQLPLCAAALLKQRPSLIAAAVRAFCERDTLDSKALRTMRYFPPEAERVRTNVVFTRCLYAMLMHNQYKPERKIGWNLSNAINTEEYKEQILGVKIASGLEILATQAKNTSDNIEKTSTWCAYLRSLTQKGYFHNNLEGSEEYKRLLDEALNYYKLNQARFRTAPLVGAEILEVLQSSDASTEQLRDEENNLRPSDSDDWLNVSAEELDTMLIERYGVKKLYRPNGDMNAAEFTKQLNDFLEKKSNFEGIEHAGLDSDDDDSDDDHEHSGQKSAAAFKAKVKKNHSMRRACQKNPLLDKPNKKQHNEEENASTHVRNFLDFVIPEDNWDSNSEMSDYEDENDLERNFDAMAARADFKLDKDIKAYMDQMDHELANIAVDQTFRNKNSYNGETAANPLDTEDDFDDIENFEPININVNTLKNMLDSYKSQVGGAGPVSNLFSAMGAGMSVAAATVSNSTSDDAKKPKDLSESTV